MACTSNEPPPLEWIKPSDVMKLHQLKLKRRKLEKRLGIAERVATVANEEKCSNNKNIESAFVNPFRCNKRRLVDEISNVTDALQSDAKRKVEYNEVSFIQQLQENDVIDRVLSTKHLFNRSQKIEDHKPCEDSNITCEEVKLSGEFLPVDWSLKCGIRLTSKQPFPWSCRLTTPEEASGITSFTRCLPLCGGGLLSVQLDTSPNSQLLQCCQVWMHPSLPWLSLFPRHQSRSTMINSTTPPLPSQFHVALHSDWCQSFRSLFHLLRARQCPYFYLCGNDFTVLFRASGIGSHPRVHAFLTPSSAGLRETLTEEGVEFGMPLAPKKSAELSAEIDDTEEWLRSVCSTELVISQVRSSIRKESERIDYQPNSLLYIEDSNVQALFNYLINSKRCVMAIGSHAGVPPTLLSPVAFSGGALRNLKMRHRQADKVHILDISGPILPHTVHYLYNLLKSRSPNSDFELSLSTVKETASLSDVDEHIQLQNTAAPPVFSQQGLNDCGLEAEVLQTMCLPMKSMVMSHIVIENGQTSWT